MFVSFYIYIYIYVLVLKITRRPLNPPPRMKRGKGEGKGEEKDDFTTDQAVILPWEYIVGWSDFWEEKSVVLSCSRAPIPIFQFEMWFFNLARPNS